MEHEKGDIEKVKEFIEENKETLVQTRNAVMASISLIHKKLLKLPFKDIERIKALEITCRSFTDPILDYFQDYTDIISVRDHQKNPGREKKTPEYIG